MIANHTSEDNAAQDAANLDTLWGFRY